MWKRVRVHLLWVAVLCFASSATCLPVQAGVESEKGYITLVIYSPGGALWYDTADRTQAVVEWQDGNGAWHAVENWRATPSSPLSWEVWPKDYGTGPFRWTVYAVSEGWRMLGASASFYLPGSDGQVVQAVVTLTRLPSGEAVPPPIAPCAQPADPDFRGLWEYYRTDIGCALTPAVTIATIAEEAFQGGHMFWRSDTDEVYVVYDRQSTGAALTSGYWWLDTAKWDGSNPDGVHLSPPPGLFEPKRGFGWVWRTYLGAADGPLGWALDKEYGFDNLGRVQRFERGVIFRGSDPNRYVLLDSGQFYSQP